MLKNVRRNVRRFSKNPKPEEGKIEKKVHINETQVKFRKIMSWEIVPVVFLFTGAIVYYKFQTQFLNLLPFEAIT